MLVGMGYHQKVREMSCSCTCFACMSAKAYKLMGMPSRLLGTQRMECVLYRGEGENTD
jgi:hypothetical protein